MESVTLARSPRRAVHGVLLLDKPVGMSSQQALLRARRLLQAQKAGHTGTLDPLASGLLPVCLGAATKFSQAALEADKTYQATLTLGQTRRGGDLEGEVLLERPVVFSDAALDEVIRRFSGPIMQRPPMQSALKHQGRPLYSYARQGVEVDRPARAVTIHELQIIERRGEHLSLQVRCSKGTYVRTLAEDIGEALGCGAHLSALRRLACGGLHLRSALSLEALEALEPQQRDARLLAVDALLQECAPVRLAAQEAARFLTGLRRRTSLPDAAAVRVYGPGPAELLGLAHIKGGELIADRLLNPEEARAVAMAGHDT